MLRIIRERFRQGYRTGGFPGKEPVLPDRFRGLPVLRPEKCPSGCTACIERCPFGAVIRQSDRVEFNLGRCLFCADCPVCPHGSLTFGNDYRLAVRRREDLVLDGTELTLAAALEKKMLSMFKRSLKLRQVSAGGC
ncbi:MAG: hydrogenase, partial [Desulfobulbaceae bacterium]|nr:hydrogenase [Desulfobulbaceae bacterium]